MMLNWLPDVNLVDGTLVSTLRIVVFAGIVALLGSMWRRWRTVLVVLGIAVASGGLGWLGAWLVSDVFNVFGVSIGGVAMRRVGLGFAELGLLISVIVVAGSWRSWRRWVALLVAVASLCFTALQVNSTFGQYPTLHAALGISKFGPANDSLLRTSDLSLGDWRGRHHDLPDHGTVVSVHIPTQASNFRPRDGVVYLPPAAVADDPPQLPVIVAMTGQPGAPDDMFTAGQLQPVLDAYAAKHDGIAPIVVVPDQLGDAYQNPICVDSQQMGQVETYLMRDVPDWISHHLPVSTESSQWTLGGFSQGATCTMQMGPANTARFGHLFAISSEMQPNNAPEAEMIDQYFGGDRSAFVAKTPLGALAQHPAQGQDVLLAAGSNDADAQAAIAKFVPVAKQSGREVQTFISQGTGHDWYTVRAVLPPIIDALGNRLGLADQEEPAQTWPNVVRTTP
ncbi:esterase [Pseudoclavibacter sp. CFCC 11306]|nr:esterase [Pseudoclavibacter sp. CFCC 11306]